MIFFYLLLTSGFFTGHGQIVALTIPAVMAEVVKLKLHVAEVLGHTLQVSIVNGAEEVRVVLYRKEVNGRGVNKLHKRACVCVYVYRQ